MNIAMLWQIAQTKYHHQVHLQGTEIPILTQDAMIDLHLTMITGTDIGLTGQDPIPAVTDTAPTGQPGKTRIGNTNKSPLMTHHPNITPQMNHPVNQTRI